MFLTSLIHPWDTAKFIVLKSKEDLIPLTKLSTFVIEKFIELCCISKKRYENAFK